MTITKEVIKAEIDKVEDKYLEILYKIIRALETTIPADSDQKAWQQFIENSYGSTHDTPIERGDQGTFEIREPLS